MIDIHSHLIPYLDDGAQNLEETFNMFIEAEKEGFTDIVLTPHFLYGYYDTKTTDILEATEYFNKVLKYKNINLKIHSGMEIYVTDGIIELMKEDKLICIANSKYMLIELPLTNEVNYLKYLVDELNNRNIKVVLAHPERYIYVQNNPKIIMEYINMGCYLQCDYASILGGYGKFAKKTVKYLLKNNLVSFMGSDCHREKTIYPEIGKAIKEIRKICNDEQVEKIIKNNAEKLINGEEIFY